MCVLLTMGPALFYSVLSGIWGVCATDFMHFFVYLIGSIILAAFALAAVGGGPALAEQVGRISEWSGNELNVLPRLDPALGLPTMTILFIFTLR